MPNVFLVKRLWFTLLIAGGLFGAEPTAPAKKVLWREPKDLETRDLLYGIGGKNDMPPAGPFKFEKEDMNGTNPKFTVRDSNGVKWKVKLGPEARPETVATRLVWAAGYITDEDYFVESANLTDVPFSDLRRLKHLISSDSVAKNARFERQVKGEKKDSSWSWKTNQFAGSRELNGLRTLMAVINNWDVKDQNNTVYDGRDGEQLFVVSDLGASFGTSYRALGHEQSRGNLHAYEHSGFITHKTSEHVNFACPGPPAILTIFIPREFFSRLGLESIGHNVPRVDAHWMGTVLGRLSPAQIRDAFRSAAYSNEKVEGFARELEKRIAALNAL